MTLTFFKNKIIYLICNDGSTVEFEKDKCVVLCAMFTCQENKPQPLHASTEQGIARISEATELRKKLREMKFIETIDRLTAALQNSTDTTIVWHNACYATYTSRKKIERLRKNMIPRVVLIH